MSIEIRNVTKQYGSFDALRDVSLTIPDGQLVALLGPSGCGKTTLLRVIAGLESPDSGTVHFHGEEATSLHVRERRVGFVFQHYALFRHMSVFDNIAFGLQVRPRGTRPSKEAIRAKVHELLALIQLEHIANHYPAQLSGGQRQRVALARALAVEPKVLLLDEPFGALDAKVRVDLRRWLRRLHDEIHVTSVFVTHDQDEALEVADRVVVMNHGRVEQEGTPEEVYDRPATPFVFDFLGKVNLFHGRVHEGLAHLGGMELASPEHATAADSPAVGYVRSHDLELERTPTDAASAPATVTSVHRVGPLVRVELLLRESGERVEAEIPRDAAALLALAPQECVWVKARRLTVFVGDYQI